jgi:hypothetical protein
MSELSPSALVLAVDRLGRPPSRASRTSSSPTIAFLDRLFAGKHWKSTTCELGVLGQGSRNELLERPPRSRAWNRYPVVANVDRQPLHDTSVSVVRARTDLYADHATRLDGLRHASQASICADHCGRRRRRNAGRQGRDYFRAREEGRRVARSRAAGGPCQACIGRHQKA